LINFSRRLAHLRVEDDVKYRIYNKANTDGKQWIRVRKIVLHPSKPHN
jgi:hypothetical protein